MSATKDFRDNIYISRDFYLATMHAYGDSGAYLHGLADDQIISVGLVPPDLLKESSSTFNMTYKPSELRARFKGDFQKILREGVLVRLVSSFEEYILSFAKLIFAKDPEAFGRLNIKLDITANHLHALGSISEIKSYILNKELKKLQDLSLKEKAEYVKRYLDIDISKDSAIWGRIIEYNARRNIIVHRLGKNDDKYGSDFKNYSDRLYVPNGYLMLCINDLISMSYLIDSQILDKLNKRAPLKFVMGRSKVIISFKITDSTEPVFLEDGFIFQSKNSIVHFADISKVIRKEEGVLIIAEGKVEYIDSLINLIKQEKRRKRIGNVERGYIYKYSKQKPTIGLDLIRRAGEIYESLEDKDLALAEVISNTQLSRRISIMALELYLNKPSIAEEELIDSYHRDNGSGTYSHIAKALLISEYTLVYSRRMNKMKEITEILSRYEQ